MVFREADQHDRFYFNYNSRSSCYYRTNIINANEHNQDDEDDHGDGDDRG